jgi:hypothetical protein
VKKETCADLLIDARHDFAHFQPRYLPRRWRRLEVDAGHLPGEIHSAFENFFLMWFHNQKRLREEGRPR